MDKAKRDGLPMTPPIQIVVDTNVLYAGLRSKRGASYQLLRRLNDPRWQLNVSTALVLEYSEVLFREKSQLPIDDQAIDDFIAGLCAVARRHHIFYLWRPQSRDPDDDFLIDLAVRAGADFIISYNQKHLRAANSFGIAVVTPKQFLQTQGVIR